MTKEYLLGADLLQMVIWLTPAGTMDEGGLKQPAYLNFELSLLGPPASNEMKVRLLASPCAPPLSCTERCPSRMQQCYPCPFVPS